MNNNTSKKLKPAYGIHPVLEMLKSGKSVDKIFIKKDLHNAKIDSVKKIAFQQAIPIRYVPQIKLDKLVGNRLHQGIVAIGSMVNFVPVENVVQQAFDAGEDPFLLIVDGITDVRNFGALCRSANCCGAHAVLINSAKSAPINEDAIKTSAGALMHLNVCRTDNLKQTLRNLRHSGLTILALSEKGEKSLFKTSLLGPTAILIGGEESGIAPSNLKESSHHVFIPMYGDVGSLNASVAGTVAMYEFLRQTDNQ